MKARKILSHLDKNRDMKITRAVRTEREQHGSFTGAASEQHLRAAQTRAREVII
jgi:hypothetical protein